MNGIAEQPQAKAEKWSPCHCTWDAQAVACRVDHYTLGVLVLYTRGVVARWVDLIISDLALGSLTAARIGELERELGAAIGDLEIARAEYDYAHAEIPGSSSFIVIRLSNIGVGTEHTKH